MSHERYLLVKAKHSRKSSNPSTGTSARLHKIDGTSRGHASEKAENMQIDKSKDTLDKFTFCGADSDLVTMTETISMSLDRYKYHLKLYNRINPLEEIMKPYDECTEIFLPLPDIFKVKSEDIDYKGGFLRRRKLVEMLKKHSKIGKKVMAEEKKMAKLSKKS